jgi:hypothetical protein
MGGFAMLHALASLWTAKRYWLRLHVMHWAAVLVKKEVAGQDGGRALLVPVDKGALAAVPLGREPVVVVAAAEAAAEDGRALLGAAAVVATAGGRVAVVVGALARIGAQICAAEAPLGSLTIAWATLRHRMVSPAAAAKRVAGSVRGRGEP